MDKETYEVLNQYGEKIGRLEAGFQILAEKISKREEREKEEMLPFYLAKNPQEMHNQLEKMGWFTPKEEGLQDDFANAFRLFTEVNDRGDLIPGLKPSLISLYQTMDLRGLIWNYGIGWLSALKGGWNSEIAARKRKASDFIDKLVEERVEVAKMSANPSNLLNYMKSSDDFQFYYATREEDLKYKLKGFYDNVQSYYRGKVEKPEKVNLPIVYWGYNKKGQLIPKVLNKKVPKNSLPATFLKPYEVQKSQETTTTLSKDGWKQYTV
ncbi:MAG: hypothetical protein QXD55_01735 [Candidatus Aenigmatarchaeota archaeon]